MIETNKGLSNFGRLKKKTKPKGMHSWENKTRLLMTAPPPPHFLIAPLKMVNRKVAIKALSRDLFTNPIFNAPRNYIPR